ncbi:MAG: FtsQ-type POTRA domain-containing protein, partial [Roseococcus sp.]
MARKPAEPTTRSRSAPQPKRPSATRLWFKKRRAWLRGIGMATLAAATLGIAAIGVIALDPMARLRETTSWLAELGRGPGLSVQEIRIEGREFAPREALLAAIGITPGEAMLDFQPSAAKQRLEQIAWVESAHVERHLPGTIL